MITMSKWVVSYFILDDHSEQTKKHPQNKQTLSLYLNCRPFSGSNNMGVNTSIAKFIIWSLLIIDYLKTTCAALWNLRLWTQVSYNEKVFSFRDSNDNYCTVVGVMKVPLLTTVIIQSLFSMKSKLNLNLKDFSLSYRNQINGLSDLRITWVENVKFPSDIFDI